MAKNWKALTESGTLYDLDLRSGWVHIKPSGDGHVTMFRIWDFKNIPNDLLKLDWEIVRALPVSEVPVVGQRMYVAGKDDWRLSTPVVSIEEVEVLGAAATSQALFS